MSPLLRRLLLAALLQLAPAQTPLSQPAVTGHQKKVMSWIDVYARATCQPREVVVPLSAELVGTVAQQLVPSCVTLQRCGGCCPDDGLECVPVGQHRVRMQVLVIQYPSSELGEMSLEEHSQCECRPKKKEPSAQGDRVPLPTTAPSPAPPRAGTLAPEHPPQLTSPTPPQPQAPLPTLCPAPPAPRPPDLPLPLPTPQPPPLPGAGLRAQPRHLQVPEAAKVTHRFPDPRGCSPRRPPQTGT